MKYPSKKSLVVTDFMILLSIHHLDPGGKYEIITGKCADLKFSIKEF